jgi:wyosine [tRNA(Phe)-imidazoG37] synthetase (radical SAM superfamily)
MLIKMANKRELIVFGPVPSRRLGRSLGINNIPPKVCSYSCIYCQIGRTDKIQIEREEFYDPTEIVQAVKDKVKSTKKNDESIDFLTFVPDGEPTLDINLGKEINLLKSLSFGIKIAVISNSSLIWKKDVRKDLKSADWVSIKIDSISQNTWRKINRPYGLIKFEKILDGIMEFSKSFNGYLATETMLVHGLNTDYEELIKIADFISKINPTKSYISVPTRPPSEKWVKPANNVEINEAFQIFRDRKLDTEYLIGYEGNEFAFTDDVEKDILSITSVHPMREDAVRNFLLKAKADWDIIEKMINGDKLVEVTYKGNKFYLRKLPK